MGLSTDEGVKGDRPDRPVWIQDLRGDDQVWQRLKSEFSEALVWDKKDMRLVGLIWELPPDATNEDVRTAGRKLADRIKRVLAP
jgi:hypothetical protein